MSSAELKELRTALEAKRAEIQRLVDENVSAATHSEEAFSGVQDRGDAAEATEEEEELLGVAGQESPRLSEIDRALAKMDKGNYGLSEQSGHPIPLERLRVEPWARFTAGETAEIEQRRRERLKRRRPQS